MDEKSERSHISRESNSEPKIYVRFYLNNFSIVPMFRKNMRNEPISGTLRVKGNLNLFEEKIVQYLNGSAFHSPLL